jgi:hypothetical protein
MREAIEQGGRELLVAGKYGDPFRKREIRRHHRGPALVAVGDQIEEQLAADPIEWHEAELVDDEDVDPQESLLQPRELTRIARFEELPHEIGGSGKEHAAFLLGRFDTHAIAKCVLPVPIGPAKMRFDHVVWRQGTFSVAKGREIAAKWLLTARETGFVD